MEKRFYSIREASDLLDATYDMVWYACVTRKINPEIVGRTRLLTQEHINQLRELFERKRKKTWKK